MTCKTNKPYEAGSSFRPAFFFLSPDRRRALSAYYGYARSIDDIADDPAPGAAGKAARLDAWKDAIGRIFSGRPGADPLEEELAWAVKKFPLKRGHFLLVLEGVSLDLEKKEYAVYGELEHYMYRVASAVGLACLAIFGYEAPSAQKLAEKLGYAVQLTNIIRDAAEDFYSGRVYLPAEDLRRFGCAPEDLGGSNYTSNFIELMKFEAARAGRLYREALALAEPEHKKRLIGALVMGSLYRELLGKIERRGFRIKEGRVRLSPCEKLKALFKAWRDYSRI